MNGELDIFIKTLFLEGGSTLNRVTSLEDIIAIAWNIRNRVEEQKSRYGKTISEVCLKRLQYSCWNDRKPNEIQIGNTFEWEVCKIVAKWVAEAKSKYNPIEGATHYYNPDLCSPAWKNALRMVKYIPFLNHVFGKEK